MSYIEDYNYHHDPRVSSAKNSLWKKNFDQKSMTVEIEIYVSNRDDVKIKFPVKFEVCDICDGSGRHVNPSIDCCGISQEQFDDDPDFYDEYRNGTYDVTCYTCNGNRVVPNFDHSRFNQAQRNAFRMYKEQQEDRRAYAAEYWAERRMGA